MRSFFQRENEPAAQKKPPSPSPARPATPAKASRGAGRDTTHIARGSTVVGEISGTAELVIEGKVEGEIELGNRVVVGRRGEVNGKIVGAAVEVGGKVVGNVHGRERVQVLESGKLEGDVTSPRVVIAEGAFFKGKIEMTSGSDSRQDRQPSPAAGRPPQAPARPESSAAAPKTQNPPAKKIP